jgi:hypothetical protein
LKNIRLIIKKKAMQANEFEKKVQHVMDEFRIRPSEEVWQKVEERIHEKKRKRRGLLVILCSFIGLGLAGYGIYNYSDKQDKLQTEIISPRKTDHKENNQINRTALPKTAGPDRAAVDGKAAKNKKQKENETVRLSAKSSKNHFISKDETITQASINRDQVVDEKLTPDSILVEQMNRPLSGNEPRMSPVGLNQRIETNWRIGEIALTSFTDSALAKLLGNSVKPEIQAINNEKTANRLSGKQWGINFSAGSSVITNNRFSFKSSTAGFDAVRSQSNPSGAGLGRFPESSNEAVFAFKAGAVVKKQVSLRSNLSAGLEYAYLGDRIKAASVATSVPSQLFSSVGSSYYRAVPQKTHEGHFHFIELPLLYHWRMSKNDKHFLSLNGGASIGYLLGTIALTYDTSFGGIYRHDKSLFTKTHFNLISGFSYHVAGNLEWSIGPQFSFDLTRIIKSNIDQRKYFLYAGIDTRIFFQPRKNK